mmetsp:Transcript_20003/g.47024  ORF Transcript_20003/g.47024 Transcript_20003/m.47024 type:complete len:106 (+) Transcript_20003:1252-1569(+)
MYISSCSSKSLAAAVEKRVEVCLFVLLSFGRKELDNESLVHFRLCGSSARIVNNRGVCAAEASRLLFRVNPLTRMAEAEDCMACHSASLVCVTRPLSSMLTKPKV